MSTVAFRVFMPTASWLMRSSSSCLVAVCNLAVLVRISTMRVRNRHPVSPRRSAIRQPARRIGERLMLDQEVDGPNNQYIFAAEPGGTPSLFQYKMSLKQGSVSNTR